MPGRDWARYAHEPRASAHPAFRGGGGCVFAIALGVVLVDMVDSQAQSQPTSRPASRPAAEPVPKAPNPHWTKEDCFVCHERAADGSTRPIELTGVNAACWTCHDGKRAHQEVHPVARRFVGEQIIAPPGWPIPDGELSCVTCHDFGPGHAKGGPRPERNAWMLRGYTGGSLAPFCAKCHVASPAHKPFNPHIMLRDNGQVNLRNCLLCHQETSDVVTRTTRAGRSDLLAEEISLCVRCHTRHVDYFEPGHIGAPVPPPMRDDMLAGEDAGMSGTLIRSHVEAHRRRNREPQRLPLNRDGRVVCSTCHNPHQEGLFPADSPLGFGGMKTHERDGPLEMRGLGKDICRGCHDQ